MDDNLSNIKYDFIKSLIKKNIIPNMNTLKKISDYNESTEMIIQDKIETKEKVTIIEKHKGE